MFGKLRLFIGLRICALVEVKCWDNQRVQIIEVQAFEVALYCSLCMLFLSCVEEM